LLAANLVCRSRFPRSFDAPASDQHVLVQELHKKAYAAGIAGMIYPNEYVAAKPPRRSRRGW
jgi:hypothetical protein